MQKRECADELQYIPANNNEQLILLSAHMHIRTIAHQKITQL